MASRQSTVDFILDQLREAGDVRAKKMFGEYGVYLDERIFALICDDNLYIKPTPEGAEVYTDAEFGPPYPGAKPHFLVPADRWEDAEWLCQLARTTVRALPPASAKKGKGKGKG